MSGELSILIITALSIGFFHTLFGPDHYLPFIMMSRSGEWSLKKTAFITFISGLAHVLSSVVLGIIGVLSGIALSKLEFIEAFRGNLAAWLLIAFGLVYLIWGIRAAIKNKPHTHIHVHKDGVKHEHQHTHNNEHSHIHEKKDGRMTPWVLFTIFLFGPCEPLIPVLMYPAAQKSITGLVIVTLVFAVTTISTMLTVVMLSAKGLSIFNFSKIERFTHAIAGGTVLLCGSAIQFLGL